MKLNPPWPRAGAGFLFQMANLLHQFLHSCNVQAQPFLGELFDYGIQAGLTGSFTPTDAKLAFELTGYMEEIDLVATVDLSQFTPGNEPALKMLMNYAGFLYSLRSLKTDQSAYVIGMKMLGPLNSIPSITPQSFTVQLRPRDESKAVVFPSVFPASPRGIYVTLFVPSGGYTFQVVVDATTISASGFTALLGAAVPDTGYALNVIAIL
jgi:hypothetical protein